MTSAAVPEIDYDLLTTHAPEVIARLAQLAQAVMRRQEAGDTIHQDIKVSTGNAVAILCKCVKQENGDAGQRTPAGQEGDKGSRAFSSAANSPGRVRADQHDGMGKAKSQNLSPGVRPRLRARRQRPDPGAPDKSEAEHEVDRQYGITL